MEKQPERYYIDERPGCVALRDRTLDDPAILGLDEDTPGVVRYWYANIKRTQCKECGTENGWYWKVRSEDLRKALDLRSQLNRGEIRGPTAAR